MKRFFAIVLLAVMILPMRISAQSLSKQNQAPVSFSNFVTNSFINYYTTGGVQEKLYVVTDKPFYSAGDTIYFSAFLVNSIYTIIDSRFYHRNCLTEPYDERTKL